MMTGWMDMNGRSRDNRSAMRMLAIYEYNLYDINRYIGTSAGMEVK